MSRNIIAISGGGFSTAIPSYIDEYVLSQKKVAAPVKICFIPTASNDAPGYIDTFYRAFTNCETSHLTQADFLRPGINDLVKYQDVIYVGGGNTQYMLEKWRATNFDTVLKEAYEKGTLLAGISAGAMCWFETCFSERRDGTFEEFKGLGLLPGSFCPHYNDEVRRKAYDNWQSIKSIQPNYTVNDNENLHFRNETLLARIITT